MAKLPIDYKDDQFVLVMTVKYKTGKEWYRSFGPFATRAQAKSFMNKQIKTMTSWDGPWAYSQAEVDKKYSWKITQLWTPIEREINNEPG